MLIRVSEHSTVNYALNCELFCLCQVVGEHKDHVNAVASCPTDGEHVVSVSDDHTCCIWAASKPTQYVACFPLTSPGMAVCWHMKETGKVYIAHDE